MKCIMIQHFLLVFAGIAKKRKLAHFLKTFNPCQSFPSVAIVNRKRPKYKLEEQTKPYFLELFWCKDRFLLFYKISNSVLVLQSTEYHEPCDWSLASTGGNLLGCMLPCVCSVIAHRVTRYHKPAIVTLSWPSHHVPPAKLLVQSWSLLLTFEPVNEIL